MPRLNVSRVINNSMFNQRITVYRKSGSWSGGRFSQTESTLYFTAIVVNTSPKEIIQVPEGDRITSQVTIYTKDKLYTTHQATSEIQTAGTSDEVMFSGNRYKIINSNVYSDYGFYKSIAVMMEGE